MIYSLTIEELINRPIIRSDQGYEYLNKMTDVEIQIFDREIEQILIEDNVPKQYPDWNVSVMSKYIDFDILYNLFKLNV